MSTRDEMADLPEEDILLAGEYALHLLAPEARAGFEGRLAQEPALRRAVHAWEARLVQIEAEAPGELPPPAHLRAELLRRIGGTRARRGRMWRLAWPSGALLAGVVALGLLSPVLNRPVFVPDLHADLRAAGTLVLQAGYDEDIHRLRILHEALRIPPGRARELWLLPADGSAPVSLGLVPAARDSYVTLPAALGARLAGGTLAVSDEPEGGSPTGQPTGAVLASGPLFGV
ncbi:anti-sigma factor [Pseudooceanicola sp. CBS1P-1]|uniref:Regulator of SigK n=1 Tax=Pseudooceanicola albus TaxID=2692189 RepID=A0A6L7FYA1_9RHOB|nr:MULTISPECIES: anti-sigma factor [Pseudooceanicola]MBT9383392.1 anti-sigma factor [Pseudooceanicola endophyticus]MXN16286.1 hypothetical protein [Pseudooceanicola albus]